MSAVDASDTLLRQLEANANSATDTSTSATGTSSIEDERTLSVNHTNDQHGDEDDDGTESSNSFDFTNGEPTTTACDEQDPTQNSLLRCSSPLTLPPSPTLLPLSSPVPSQLDLNAAGATTKAAEAHSQRTLPQSESQPPHHQSPSNATTQPSSNAAVLHARGAADSVTSGEGSLAHSELHAHHMNMAMNMGMGIDPQSAAAAAAAAACVQSYFHSDADASLTNFSREFNELQKSVAGLENEKRLNEEMAAKLAESAKHHSASASSTPSSTSTRKRRAGSSVSVDLQTKIRLIEMAEEYQYDPKGAGRSKQEGGQSARDQMSGIRLAAQFGLNKSTVSRILKRKEEYKKAYYKDNVSGCSKHINKKSKFEKLNRLVENWFDVTREKKVAVSDTLIRDVGKRFADELGIEDFRASNGWVRSLRNRKEQQSRNMSLEAMEREKVRRENEAIERMRMIFPRGMKDLSSFFKDLSIFIEKDSGIIASSFMAQVEAASAETEGVDKDDHVNDELLRKKMVETLREWSHELMEADLARMKKRLKPATTATPVSLVHTAPPPTHMSSDASHAMLAQHVAHLGATVAHPPPPTEQSASAAAVAPPMPTATVVSIEGRQTAIL